MNPVPITSLEEAITTFREWLSHYSPNTVRPYEYLFGKLLEVQADNPNLNGIEVVASFYEQHLQVPAFFRPKTPTAKLKAGRLLRVVSLLRGDEIPLKCKFGSSFIVIAWYSEIQREYSEWMLSTNKTVITIETRTSRMRIFFAYMEQCRIYKIQNLALNDFVGFIGSLCTSGYSSQGKYNILYTVRDFLKCPYVNEKLSCNPMPLLCCMHTNKHERLPSFYSAEEVQRLLGVIDRSKPTGTLSYIVILLAGIYGLRSKDIRELKLESIRWDINQISLIQKKTTRYLELPLIAEVKWALLDYIKNVRPKVKDPHIFIRTRLPQMPYSKNDHFTYLINPYFKIAGIDTTNKHHGLHSLRHSLATKLTEMEVPLNEVATILGHSTANTTLKYIWSDIQHLSLAAEEVLPHAK